MEMEDLLTMRWVVRLKMHVSQPNKHCKVLTLEDGKQRHSDLFQNRATCGWSRRNLNDKKKKIGGGTTRIDTEATEMYVKVVINM